MYSIYQRITYIFLDDNRSKSNINSYIEYIKLSNCALYAASWRSERGFRAYSDNKEWFNCCDSKNRRTKDKRTKQTNGQNDLMPTCALTLRARGGEDAAVLYSFSYCFILTLDLHQYTHTKENTSLKQIEINWNI